ncbi:MAG: type II secretion system F family protein [Planctomycetes bacterium]|nr:type II secretion system F family protein [Planctomycetota bacterium]
MNVTTSRHDSLDRALFHEALAGLCRSELPLDEALRIASADIEETELRRRVQTVADDVARGTSFDEAYARHCSPRADHVAIVKAGIACNDLAGALEDVAKDERLSTELDEELDRALARPLISALVVGSVGFVVLMITMPWSAMQGTMVSLDWPLASTPLDKGLSNVAWNTIASSALACLVVLAGVVAWHLRKGRRGILRLPVFRKLLEQAERARFASTLAMLLRRRVPLDRSLEIACLGLSSPRLREAGSRARVSAADGARLAEALGQTGLLSDDVLFYVASAESLGDAPAALKQLATIEERRFRRHAQAATRSVGPAFEVAIGLVVFVFALAYLHPALRLFAGLFGN